MKNLIILGAGTAGTMMANRLAKRLPDDEWTIYVVDRDNKHIYQPGLIFVPFGMERARRLVRPRTNYLPRNVELLLQPIDRVDPAANTIVFENGQVLSYDLLIIATGSHPTADATEGMTGVGWYRNIFDFYSLEGAERLRHHLAHWKGGRLVVNVVDNPIKCPVAPLEFLFLADAFLTQAGVRDKAEIVYVTPLDGAFTKPRASAALGDMLEQRGIKVESNFLTGRVDGENDVLESFDGREVNYDLLVTIPIHNGAALMTRSELADEDGWVPTDRHTLQSKSFDNIFIVGDAGDLPTSKAGSVAHFAAEVLTENIEAWVDGRELEPAFDGHANCFIETGHGKAMLIDFNYKTEPLPGRFPLPGVGPFTLLEESYANHWGKLGFHWAYWNLLVKGKDIPIDHRMLMAGKWS